MTEELNGQLENTTDENMTEMLNEQVTELESLSTSVSEASSAAELQEVVLTYMQTQAVESLEKEIEHVEARVSESENSTDDISENVTELNDKITELTALIEEINAAESLEDLKEIMYSSSQGMPGMGPGMGQGPMHGGCNCPMGPGNPENSVENSTEA
jgi:phage shock protein A